MKAIMEMGLIALVSGKECISVISSYNERPDLRLYNLIWYIPFVINLNCDSLLMHDRTRTLDKLLDKIYDKIGRISYAFWYRKNIR